MQSRYTSNSLMPETASLIEEVALRILESGGSLRSHLGNANVHLCAAFQELRVAEEIRRATPQQRHLVGR